MRCQVAWGVCDRCLGHVLNVDRGRATCGRCNREWAEADVAPCPYPSVAVDRKTGFHICESHAAFAKSDRAADRLGLGCGLFLFAFAGAGVLGALYLVVRFVRWAWTTPLL